MAATVAERFGGTSADSTSSQLEFIVRGATDEVDAFGAVESHAPLTHGGYEREDVSVEEVRYPDIWIGTAKYNYKPLKPFPTDALDYSFDTSLGSKRIYRSLSTPNTYGGSQPFYGQIAVDQSGQAQGIDIATPQSAFSYTWYPASGTVSEAYQRTVQGLVGHVNSTAFKGYAAGEVLFVGASGRSRNNTDWEISYSFNYNANVTGLTIGTISGIAVDGWDVMWVYYGRTTESGRYSQKPLQVNVERVYPRSSFGALGLP
jgi:hypothetical protein